MRWWTISLLVLPSLWSLNIKSNLFWFEGLIKSKENIELFISKILEKRYPSSNEGTVPLNSLHRFAWCVWVCFFKHRLFLLFYYHSKNSTLKRSSILRVSIFPLWNNYYSKKKRKDLWPNRTVVKQERLSICSWEEVQR